MTNEELDAIRDDLKTAAEFGYCPCCHSECFVLAGNCRGCGSRSESSRTPLPKVVSRCEQLLEAVEDAKQNLGFGSLNGDLSDWLYCWLRDRGGFSRAVLAAILSRNYGDYSECLRLLTEMEPAAATPTGSSQ